MSFVAKVLQVSSKLEKEELSQQLNLLSRQLEETKRQLHEDVTSRYLDFNTHYAKSEELAGRISRLLQEAVELQGKVDEHVLQQLQNSTSEFQDLSRQLQETKTALEILQQLVRVEDSMDAAKEAQTQGNHLERARKLKEAEEMLPPLSCGKDNEGGGEELGLLKALREGLVLQREILLFDLGEAWKETWIMEEEEVKTTKKITLRIRQPSPDWLAALTGSMRLHGELDVKLRRLGSRVLSTLIQPLARHHAVTKKILSPDNHPVLVVVVDLEECQPQFSSVVGSIQTILDFLAEVFSQEEVKDPQATVMRHFGLGVAKDFCEFFLRDCVLPNLPDSSKELEKYSQVLESLDTFQRHLEEIGFLDTSNGHMLDHAKDVDILFANHLSRRLLAQARSLMLEDLQDSETVEEEVKEAAAPTSLQSGHPIKNPFAFPRCQISKSTRALLQLVEQALEEACVSTAFSAGRLLYTCRSVFELYCSVVPQHHSQLLEEVLQQSALLHNNCMFLAHRLLLMAHQVRPRLPPPLCHSTLTFVDLAPMLRHTGTQAFLRQMRRQRQHFYDILKEGFPMLSVSTSLPPAADRALQQCIHQLGHLENVWKPVLPLHVYRKAIGTLLNSILEELLIRITTVEDIPADSAIFLVTVLGVFLDQSPAVFKDLDGKEVSLSELCRLVPRWEKFQELVRVLDASLRELEERWADGQGPLAQHFTPDELKHLIRALFQNTDRRAAVLAKIK